MQGQKMLNAPNELRPLNQSLRQTGMCRFLPVNVSLPVKNKVACTKYRLKLSALCDLLEILCPLATEASGSSG